MDGSRTENTLLAFAETGLYLVKLLDNLSTMNLSDTAVGHQAVDLLRILRQLNTQESAISSNSEGSSKGVSCRFKTMLVNMLEDKRGLAGRHYCEPCDLTVESLRQWKKHKCQPPHPKVTVHKCNDCGMTIRVTESKRQLYVDSIEHKITDTIARCRGIPMDKAFLIELAEGGIPRSSVIPDLPTNEARGFQDWMNNIVGPVMAMGYRCVTCSSNCMSLHQFLGHVAGHLERDSWQGIICRPCAQFILGRSDLDLIDHMMQVHIKPSLEVKTRLEPSLETSVDVAHDSRCVTTKSSSGSSQLGDGEVILVPSSSVNSTAPSTIEGNQLSNKKTLLAVSSSSVDNGNPELLTNARPSENLLPFVPSVSSNTVARLRVDKTSPSDMIPDVSSTSLDVSAPLHHVKVPQPEKKTMMQSNVSSTSPIVALLQTDGNPNEKVLQCPTASNTPSQSSKKWVQEQKTVKQTASLNDGVVSSHTSGNQSLHKVAAVESATSSILAATPQTNRNRSSDSIPLVSSSSSDCNTSLHPSGNQSRDKPAYTLSIPSCSSSPVSDVSSSVVISEENGFNEKFLPFLRCLTERCRIEGFIPSSKTGFYCGLCHVGTTYYGNWRSHLQLGSHLDRLKAHDGIQHMPPCKSCGLQLCAHESLIPMYMSCRQHCDLDALASVTPVTTRHLRTPQTTSEIKKLTINNAQFIKENIKHDSCCTKETHEGPASVPGIFDLPKISPQEFYAVSFNKSFPLDILYIFKMGSEVEEYLKSDLEEDWTRLVGQSVSSVTVYCHSCSSSSQLSIEQALKHFKTVKHSKKRSSNRYGLLCTICASYIVTHMPGLFWSHLENWACHREKEVTMLEVIAMKARPKGNNLQFVETINRINNTYYNFSKCQNCRLVQKTDLGFSIYVMPRRNIISQPVSQQKLFDVGSLLQTNIPVQSFICYICDPNDSVASVQLERHLRSRGHYFRKLVATNNCEADSDSEHTEAERDSVKDEDDDGVENSGGRDSKAWICHVCSTAFLHIDRTIVEMHMNSSKHFTAVLRLLRQQPPLPLSNKIIIKLDSIKYEVMFLSDLSQESIWDNFNVKKLFVLCQLCDVEGNIFFKNLRDLRLHLSGKAHCRALRACPPQAVPIFVRCGLCNVILVACAISPHDVISLHCFNRYHQSNASGYKGYDIDDGPVAECKVMFSSIDVLCYNVFQSLLTINMTSQGSEDIAAIFRVDILALVRRVFPEAAVHIFGSRATGLGRPDSDVDIFLDTGGLFYGMYPWPKSSKLTQLARLLEFPRSPFRVVCVIPGARVPILKLEHIPLGLKCDLNCYNGSGVENSRLIKVYLSMDLRAMWLVQTISEWARLNRIKDSSALPSYGVVWMVLFYLMQPHVALLPPVIFLFDLYIGPKAIIGGWDYSFVSDVNVILEYYNPVERCLMSRVQLLEGFFQFYHDLDVKNVVLCPTTGEMVQRAVFDTIEMPARLRSHLKFNQTSPDELKLRKTVILLDPFALKFNILRRVSFILWEHFKLLCKETLDLGGWRWDPRSAPSSPHHVPFPIINKQLM